MRFLNTFRGRLVLVLAVLLMATLGFQYYLNLATQRENNDLREKQERAIVAAITLGFTAITTEDDNLQDLIEKPGQTFLDDDAKERIRDIIIINNDWKITDSLNPKYWPAYGDNEQVVYKDLADIKDLPPLLEGERLGDAIKYFPNAGPAAAGAQPQDEAHAVPLETSKGRWHVMVLLKNDRNEALWRAARPLIYTLGILLVSSLITFLLVFRFTRPIADLSQAARQVAGGNLNVRVPENSFDELGRLGANFNEMTAELEKNRDLEAQLQQAEKSAVVGRLGSAIAHEIRNPLNYINLTLDHLRSKFSPDDPERREKFTRLTGQLKAEVARINQQISDFLNYSRPATAKLVAMTAREAIEESLRIIEPQAAEKNVTLGVVEHENVSKIMGDREFLRSVFNNLLINAIHAMEPDGGHLSLRITADEDEDLVSFEVSDTGAGIAEENLRKIFEPYFSTKETGTGLGLAIVQKIVDIHHGRIDVESTVGEGTKFTVRLPAAAA